MSKEDIQQVGRLAFREEGDNWVAYFAPLKGMEGALFLGAIRMGIALVPERKAEFIAFMRSAVGDMMEHAHGVRPVWPGEMTPAPENERTKKA